ncbi:MAG: hypothetical protein ACU84Q_14880, partial [Gammaproteobacteria bacterium]
MLFDGHQGKNSVALTTPSSESLLYIEGQNTRLVCITLALFTLLFNAVSSAKPVLNDWSDKPPPEGWSSDAYSPTATSPDFSEEYEPEYSDGSYNSFEDPYHPLKNPDKDPGPDWNRPHGANMPDNSPGVVTVNGDWDWGEKYFESEFESALIITNNCSTPQPVKLTIDNLPYLTLPEKVLVPPGQTPVKAKIKMPPTPPLPIRLGLPGEPDPRWGHVQFPPFVVPPGQPPPKLHQPNFTQINGTVTAWHPWMPASANC